MTPADRMQKELLAALRKNSWRGLVAVDFALEAVVPVVEKLCREAAADALEKAATGES